jgi:hypothetical protein
MERMAVEARTELESARMEVDSIKRLVRRSWFDYQSALRGDLYSRKRHWHILKTSEEALRSLLDRSLNASLVHEICAETEAIHLHRKRLLFTSLTGSLRKGPPRA